MSRRRSLLYLAPALLCFQLQVMPAVAREITFCGEQIPVSNVFVAQKLMNVIRKQVPYVNLPQLRKQAERYFPLVEYYLKGTNLPGDLKYIPIIESGFRNVTSKAGAQGFWQLMEATAREWGLIVNGQVDERNDINKSTLAACKELARLYKSIQRDYRISSWVLSAAAYNYGIGNMYNKMNRQGNNYFTMDLNPETAVYVYKIIAVKELFEFPELYMKNFQFNVFSAHTGAGKKGQPEPAEDMNEFKSLEVKVREDDGAHPDDLTVKNIAPPKESDLEKDERAFRQAKLAGARIVGTYANFKDGGTILVELQEHIQTRNSFQRSGSHIHAKGWIINGRVFIDLGFEGNDVILYDSKSKQGIALSSLKNKEQVILKIQN